MFKSMYLLCTSLVALSMGTLQADLPEAASESESDFFTPFSSEIAAITPAEMTAAATDSALGESALPVLESAPATGSLEAAPIAKKEKPKGLFKPFTGKVKGKKVRLRTQPDLDSSIVKELQKGEYLAVVDEVDDFWITEAPGDLKAYVFRSFVLDNTIEGNRVNVRLHPNMDAPIIVHLNSGDTIDGAICESNHKWIEISAPKTSRFYVSKNYIENVGGPEVKDSHETRLGQVKDQISLAQSFAESEMKKAYNEIDFDLMNRNFQVVIQDYTDFPEFTDQAKDQLSALQEKFIDKRISYMESKANQQERSLAVSSASTKEHLFVNAAPTDKMKLWEPVEEALFLSWANAHEARDFQDYQLEQKIAAEKISGILETYAAPVKCKPGDYVIKQNDLPVGYVYSTVVNLQDLVGKKVSLIGAPRPNNNFAFPAYFVIGVED